MPGLAKQVNPVSVKQGQKAVLPCSLTTSNFESLHVVGGGWRPPPNVEAPWLPSLDTSNSKELRWKGDTSKKVTFPKEKLGTNLNITLLKVRSSRPVLWYWSPLPASPNLTLAFSLCLTLHHLLLFWEHCANVMVARWLRVVPVRVEVELSI